MANVVVLGSQWGDEGKGKIVDWLSERADVVVRFQGGHNAGHTLVIGDNVYKTSALPSGVVRPDKVSVVGNGVVVDPWAFMAEIEKLRGQGLEISPDNLKLADNAPLILPIHVRLDEMRETSNEIRKIGTTKRGIGPAYEDKIGRRALRLIDLADPDTLADKVTALLDHHNALRRGYGREELDGTEVVEQLKEVAPKILPYMTRVWQYLNDAKIDGKRILFEGAQGMLLDIDHGTYPYVTSSNMAAAQAATGSGMAPRDISYVLGITKAYTTRVGEGPFPTELHDEIGQYLGEKGHEFGVVTGRSRRCGWFDAVIVRQTVITGGVDGIALTKMDVLDGMDEIKICTGYELDGQVIDYLPAGAPEQARVKPIYESFEGWKGTTAGARTWNDLPAQAVKYVRRIEELIGAPVASVSTSPQRDDTILVRDPFAD